MSTHMVLYQAIFVVILLLQYQSKIKVKADEQKVTANSWFHNLEKKLNAIQDVMQDVFHNVKQSARHILPLPNQYTRKLPHIEDIRQASTVAPSEAKIYSDFFLNENIGENNENIKNSIKTLSESVSDISESKNEENVINEAGTAELEQPLKKSKTKKHKKTKPIKTYTWEDNEKSETKVRRKHKKKYGNRTFVKTAVSQSNNSDSNESRQRGKPVDIIVHIKMSE